MKAEEMGYQVLSSLRLDQQVLLDEAGLHADDVSVSSARHPLGDLLECIPSPSKARQARQ